MRKYLLIPMLFFLTILAFSLASAAVIKTIPEKQVWIADGVTEYKVFVYLDNTGLGGEPTDGVAWKFKNHPILPFVTGSESLPDHSEDFFAGISMFMNNVAPPEQYSTRIVDVFGSGPVDHQGYLGVYKFKVPQNTTPGWYNFSLTNTALSDPYGSPQPHTRENIQFRVMKKLKPIYTGPSSYERVANVTPYPSP